MQGALGTERLPAEDAVAGGALAVADLTNEDDCDVGGTPHPGILVTVAVVSSGSSSHRRTKPFSL
jgi:hypothetical protein